MALQLGQSSRKRKSLDCQDVVYSRIVVLRLDNLTALPRLYEHPIKTALTGDESLQNL